MNQSQTMSNASRILLKHDSSLFKYYSLSFFFYGKKRKRSLGGRLDMTRIPFSDVPKNAAMKRYFIIKEERNNLKTHTQTHTPKKKEKKYYQLMEYQRIDKQSSFTATIGGEISF